MNISCVWKQVATSSSSSSSCVLTLNKWGVGACNTCPAVSYFFPSESLSEAVSLHIWENLTSTKSNTGAVRRVSTLKYTGCDSLWMLFFSSSSSSKDPTQNSVWNVQNTADSLITVKHLDQFSGMQPNKMLNNTFIYYLLRFHYRILSTMALRLTSWPFSEGSSLTAAQGDASLTYLHLNCTSKDKHSFFIVVRT